MTPPDTSDSQKNKLLIVLEFYKENWDHLTEEAVIELASFLTGVKIDMMYTVSGAVKLTERQEKKYWDWRFQHLFEIMEREKYFQKLIAEDGDPKPVNKMTIDEFLENYQQIAEDNP